VTEGQSHHPTSSLVPFEPTPKPKVRALRSLASLQAVLERGGQEEFIDWSCRRFPPAVTLECVSDVTRILDSIQRGDPKAGEELLPLVYEELRKLAAQKLAYEQPGQTLQATALVHEAWLPLSGGEDRQWDNRRHFLVRRRRRCAAFS